jgi:hypothetical protein
MTNEELIARARKQMEARKRSVDIGYEAFDPPRMVVDTVNFIEDHGLKELLGEFIENYEANEHLDKLCVQRFWSLREKDAEIERLKKEVEEQCRLNGMGAQRELKLMTEIEELKKINQALTAENKIVKAEVVKLAHHVGFLMTEIEKLKSLNLGLQARYSEALEESSMLDWMIENASSRRGAFGSTHKVLQFEYHASNDPRDAIRKAMKESKDAD